MLSHLVNAKRPWLQPSMKGYCRYPGMYLFQICKVWGGQICTLHTNSCLKGWFIYPASCNMTPFTCVVPCSNRYYNLLLPVHDDQYILNHAFVQAQGHRAVSRMLPFLLQGLLDAHFLELVIAWEQFQQLCHGERRPGGLTRSVGQEIRLVREKLFLKLTRVFWSLKMQVDVLDFAMQWWLEQLKFQKFNVKHNLAPTSSNLFGSCSSCIAICRSAANRLIFLANRVLPRRDISSIKMHYVLEHAWRDILNHGNPYNHDAQGM